MFAMASGPRTSSSSPQNPPDLLRVILLMDVDCFEVQVWAKKKGIDQEDVPVIVLNHLDMQLSVNYQARALGIPKTKGKVDVDELQAKYPELRIIRAELKRGLTDTLLLQQESDKILDAINSHPVFERIQSTTVMERSNNDEMYIDCTEIAREIMESPQSPLTSHSKSCPTLELCLDCRQMLAEISDYTVDWDEPHIVFEDAEQFESDQFEPELEYVVDSLDESIFPDDFNNNSMLIHGTELARAFHLRIREQTGYRVSFGVSYNKMLAKIACELNKPYTITVLTSSGRQRLFQTLELGKLPGFKSETGEELRKIAWFKFGLELLTLEDVRKCPRRVLDKIFDRIRQSKPNLKEGTVSLQRKLGGICDQPVVAKYYNDSMRKSLPLYGANSIRSWQQLGQRIEDLAVVFRDKLMYYFQRYNMKSALISVKTEVKRGGMRIVGNVQNTLEVFSILPTPAELQQFIEEYVERSHGSYYQHVTRIWIIASNFATDG